MCVCELCARMDFNRHIRELHNLSLTGLHLHSKVSCVLAREIEKFLS